MSAKKKLPKSRKKGAWFVKLRGSYIPCSPLGWLTYIPYVAFVLLGFYPTYAVIRSFHFFDDMSVGFLLSQLMISFIFVVPFEVALVAIMHWVAKQKS